MDTHFLPFLEILKKEKTANAIYEHIISFGKSSPYKAKWDFTKKDEVIGCQSLLYVRAHLFCDKLNFEFYSDAIISQGLAALLIHFYQGCTLKELLQTPPIFFKDLNLGHLLSPGRSNGVNSLYRKMIELALITCKER